VSPRLALVLGLACLVAAQCLASFVLTPLRGGLVANRDVFGALKPGEFAGTLMLGGFRGLACDLLWLRAQRAKDEGRFYESVALAGSITRIQPRFEQIWEYLAWDMAYNLAAEVDDPAAKWAWFITGVETNAEGCLRNPQGERLVRHLAWMFHHKGDDFRERIAGASWARLVNPLLERLNQRLPGERRLELLPTEPGLSNYAISALLYRAAERAAEVNGLKLAPFVRRMVPLALERDANQLRNRGEHLVALRRYLVALAEWQPVLAWSELPPTGDDMADDQRINRDIYQHNEGRLRRKVALFAERLAPDAAASARLQAAVEAKRWDAAAKELDEGGWKAAVDRARVRWLDEAGKP
jgi:hypothetical protein